MDTSAIETDSLIMCRNSQGFDIRATLLQLSRHQVTFEVYSTQIVLRLSEVLSDFQIVAKQETLYSGKAVISNLINTGLTWVCEASLDGSWTDPSMFSLVGEPGKLRVGFDEFIRIWQKTYKLVPEYKVVVADIQSLLVEMRNWLEQVELGIRASPSGDRRQFEQEIMKSLSSSTTGALSAMFGRFEEVVQSVEKDLQGAHQAFGQRQLHPLLLASPFAYRSYQKPLGYAGDYEMVNMMMRDPFEGASLFAKAVNAFGLDMPPIRAHRYRIQYLAERLSRELRRAVWYKHNLRVLNVGCGPAWEVQKVLAEDDLADKAQFTLIDFNEETLDHIRQVLGDLKRKHSRSTGFQFVRRSVQQMLKQSMKPNQGGGSEQYEFIYCAGLYDYLSDPICKNLNSYFYQLLAPGGLLVVTNVDTNPTRYEMEYFLEWHLIYRNTSKMLALAPDNLGGEPPCTYRDDTGTNILLEIRKPDRV